MLQVEQSSASVTAESTNESSQAIPDNDYMQALTALPFTVLQSISDGAFTDFVVSKHESKIVADIKRSLMRDLNPKTDVDKTATKKVCSRTIRIAWV